MTRRSSTFFRFFLPAFLVLPVFAFAHATPITYVPDNGVQIAHAPSEVSIIFSERLERGASSVTVFYPDGTQSKGGEFGEDPRAMRIPLIGPTMGNYAVTWQVISSDDGHFTKGAFSFTVGTGTASASLNPASFSIVHRSSILDGFAVSLELFGEGILLSLFGFLFLIVRPLRHAFPTTPGENIGGRVFVWVGVAAGSFLVVGSAIFLAENAVAFQEFREGGTLSGSLRIFSATAAGFWAWVQVGAGIIAGVLVFLGGKRLWKGELLGVFGWVSLLSVAIAIFARSRVSHAAASHILPDFSVGVNVFHLIGKHGWVDFLLVLTVLTPFLLRELGGAKEALFRIYRRADIVLSGAFALTAVTGSYIVWLHLKDITNLTATLWGKRAMMLLFATAVLVLIRLWNHVQFGKVAKDPQALSRLSRTLGAEFGVGAVVAVVTAFIILTSPPVDASPLEMRAQSRDAFVSLSPSRTEDGMMLVTATDRAGRGIPITTATIVASNALAGVTDVIPPAEERFVGGVVFPLRTLTPEGDWSLVISLSREGGYDVVGTFQLSTPIPPASEWPSKGYTILFIVISLGAVALAVVLVLRTKKQSPSLGSAGSTTENIYTLPPLVVGGAVSLLVAAAVLLAGQHILRSSMEKDCLLQGLMWHSSVPMKDWTPTSAVSRDGCSFHIGAGMYHLVDPREYEFLKWEYPPGTFTAMDHSMHGF